RSWTLLYSSTSKPSSPQPRAAAMSVRFCAGVTREKVGSAVEAMDSGILAAFASYPERSRGPQVLQSRTRSVREPYGSDTALGPFMFRYIHAVGIPSLALGTLEKATLRGKGREQREISLCPLHVFPDLLSQCLDRRELDFRAPPAQKRNFHCGL